MSDHMSLLVFLGHTRGCGGLIQLRGLHNLPPAEVRWPLIAGSAVLGGIPDFGGGEAARHWGTRRIEIVMQDDNEQL